MRGLVTFTAQQWADLPYLARLESLLDGDLPRLDPSARETLLVVDQETLAFIATGRVS